jgi:hypothetical protein
MTGAGRDMPPSLPPSAPLRRRVAVLVLALAALTACLGPASAAQVRFARLKYGGGGDWYANPTGLTNLIRAVRARTTIDVAPREDVVTLGDDRLFDYAMLFATGHGRIAFKPEEARRLRRYLLTGGFLHVDDNFGMDESFRPALKAVFPDRSAVELPFSHPIYHCLYQFPGGPPKIHEHHGGPPHAYGILNEGRVVLFYSYNTDINDGWEGPDVHHDPPARREAALRLGLNLVVYALTH